MELVTRVWKDPVWSKVISAAIIGAIVWIGQHYLGNAVAFAYANAFTPIFLPHWMIWLWAAVTVALAFVAGWALLCKRAANIETVSAKPTALDPKIEIATKSTAPYHVTDVKSDQVQSTVRIGVKNAGGRTLSNCKVYIEKISPPTGSPGGTTLLLDGTGFQLRHDDPERFVEVAAHWGSSDKFRFSTPIGGGFFDSTQWLDDNTLRTFAIRVTATECERSALFEIRVDESKKLHLRFLNYIN
ncbi:MAG: hypothetical protein EPN70_10045 [Paraburkholderia sp.]|uniref:IPT/TIG domain-containing protein n=1 Tax=Paraburkholderia sp. TaxID=1926495 RepID=UPI00120D78C5|nr:IPT/TIG domain-containing protein [Paraburkholderia sp.]TAM04896.1 MAG: hypothetical protein EPN70_10045 [Paraburkholderia sp.]TAM29600.1 MAG: hypothetical protein EPN59_11670 [Paraburkholderia sp.]